MITTGIENEVKEFENRLTKRIREAKVPPNKIEDLVALCEVNDIILLETMEALNSPDACNDWLVGLLVDTGLYKAAGKGFVDLVVRN